MERLSSDTAEHALTPDASGLALSRRLAALAGQLRAIGALAVSAGEASGLRDRRPHARTNRPIERFKAGVAVLRANASLDSPAGRHALRLAVVVLLAELISRHLPLSRSYWMVVAAATTLRPEFGATFTRGAERAGGTALGVGLAGAIAVALHPAGAVTVVLVGVLAWAGYALFPASFAVGFAFITAVVVFLLNAISPGHARDRVGAAARHARRRHARPARLRAVADVVRDAPRASRWPIWWRPSERTCGRSWRRSSTAGGPTTARCACSAGASG